MEGLTHRDILMALLALGGMGALAVGGDRLRSGFLIFVCTLGLGYRTLPITEVLRLHPAELALWGSLGFLPRRGTPGWEPGTEVRFPLWLWLFMPFWLVGWIPSSENTYPFDVRFSDFRNFLLLCPLFAIAPAVLTSGEWWRRVVAAYYGVGVWVAFFGVLEYLVPGIQNVLPGFVGDPSATIASDGFARARFSFWGGPHATFLCVLATPFTPLLWRLYPATKERAANIAGLFIQLVAIYIAGYRSMWLLTAIQWLLLLALKKRYGLLLLLALLTVGGYEFLPVETQARLESLAMVLVGKPVDSSGIKRQNRSLEALDQAFESPAGCGWAGSGWVHSDFIQVAANLGVAAGIVFLGGYLYTLCRLSAGVMASSPAEDRTQYGLALLSSFVAAGGMLAFEGIQVLPQTVLPVWLIWVLTETWLRQQ
jgi:hypothetical protein